MISVLADRLDVPLLVVLSGEPNTGLTADLLGDVLAGANPLTFTFDAGTIGAMDSGPIKLRATDAPPRWRPELSGVALLEVNDGADATLTVWPISSATRSLPPLNAAHVRWQRHL